MRTLLTAVLLWFAVSCHAWAPRLFAAEEPRAERGVTVEETMAGRFDAGRKWAILIGVDKYLDPQIPSLDYCVADARLMADTLSKRCGYEAERILLLTDDQDKDHLKPLGINLRKQIPGWLKNAQPGDTVLIFFSGHGFLDERGQGFLAPKDCEKVHLGLTGFRTDDLRDVLGRQELYRRLTRISDAIVAVADRVMYATVKEG